MNQLQIFDNPEFGKIRIIEINGEPWFVGKDVAAALGYSDTDKAIRDHVDSEDKKILTRQNSGFGKKSRNAAFNIPNRGLTIINESGVYSLILSSKLPSAKKFKRWITSEVLPSIRKQGSYLGSGAENAPVSKKDIADLTAAVQLLTERMDAQAARETPAWPQSLTFAFPGSMEAEQQDFGPAARKKWLRTANEKLDLLSTKLSLPHNAVLSKIYKQMEEKGGANLTEEQLRCAVSQSLSSCSILVAISYNEWLRDGFQKIVDFNLAPENRGW